MVNPTNIKVSTPPSQPPSTGPVKQPPITIQADPFDQSNTVNGSVSFNSGGANLTNAQLSEEVQKTKLSLDTQPGKVYNLLSATDGLNVSMQTGNQGLIQGLDFKLPPKGTPVKLDAITMTLKVFNADGTFQQISLQDLNKDPSGPQFKSIDLGDGTFVGLSRTPQGQPYFVVQTKDIRFQLDPDIKDRSGKNNSFSISTAILNKDYENQLLPSGDKVFKSPNGKTYSLTDLLKVDPGQEERVFLGKSPSLPPIFLNPPPGFLGGPLPHGKKEKPEKNEDDLGKDLGHDAPPTPPIPG